MDSPGGRPRLIGLSEAGQMLAVDESVVAALVRAGYLATTDEGGLAVGDVKALAARLADVPDEPAIEDLDDVDTEALLGAIHARSDEMARRSIDIFRSAFPALASRWDEGDAERFVDQSRQRFEAILAITGQGADGDIAVEMESVGASAAWTGASLPQLLVVLRISRDLVVQTAVAVAEERGRHWGLALSVLLTRILPAMDQLIDAVIRGYWEAVVAQGEETKARHESVVEHSSDGVYELGLDGRVEYANPSLAAIVGRRRSDLIGARLDEVLVTDGDGDVADLESDDGPRRVALTVVTGDGGRRELDVLAIPLRQGEVVAGHQGIVRDLTAAAEMEAKRNEFLTLITGDLRQPLATIAGLGVALEGYADELPAERIRRVGRSIRLHGERAARLADDLHDVSRLEAHSLLLAPRPVNLARTLAAGLDSVDGSEVVELRVPTGLDVTADPRRLEQIVANLVENALVHGQPPVVVDAHAADGAIEVSVLDAGEGVPDAVVATLFSRLQTVRRADRDRTRGTGLGLSLVRGLVETMGGHVWYERTAAGAAFRFTVPAAP